MTRGWAVALNVMLVLGLMTCLGSEIVPGEPQGVESPVVTPTAQPMITPSPPPVTPSPVPEDSGAAPAGDGGEMQMPLMLYFDVPESVELVPLIPVPLIIFGNDAIHQATVEINISSSHFKVRDEDTAMPGTQVMPGALPEGATVMQNVVGEDGTLRYQVSGLGASSQLSRTLLTFHMEAVAPTSEILRFDFVNAAFLGEDGTPLEVQAQSTWLEVMPAVAGAPTPTIQPTIMPSATEDVISTWESGSILPGAYYRIQRGQTLFRVAEAFDISVEALAAANGIVDTSQVRAGTLLHIPIPSPYGQAAYFVAPRETLYSIARQFGLTVEILAGYNQLTPPYNVQAGQWIILMP